MVGRRLVRFEGAGTGIDEFPRGHRSTGSPRPVAPAGTEAFLRNPEPVAVAVASGPRSAARAGGAR